MDLKGFLDSPSLSPDCGAVSKNSAHSCASLGLFSANCDIVFSHIASVKPREPPIKRTGAKSPEEKTVERGVVFLLVAGG